MVSFWVRGSTVPFDTIQQKCLCLFTANMTQSTCRFHDHSRWRHPCPRRWRCQRPGPGRPEGQAAEDAKVHNPSR